MSDAEAIIFLCTLALHGPRKNTFKEAIWLIEPVATVYLCFSVRSKLATEEQPTNRRTL